MKFVFPIALFSLLQPTALATLRGSNKLEFSTIDAHRRAGSSSMDGGCPPNQFTFESGFVPCNSQADCASECAGDDDCCCVEYTFPYCGVPEECNDTLSCMAPSPPPTPSPTRDDRDPPNPIPGPGFCADPNQPWCPALNRCAPAAQCAASVDENGCVRNHSDGAETFCASRNDCILENVLSCPNTNPDPGCNGKQLIPVSVTDQNFNMFLLDQGTVHYTNPTQILGSVTRQDGTFIGAVDFTLLHEEWKLLLGGQACAPISEIVVYMTASLRHVLHVCYTNTFPGLSSSSIPQCLGQAASDAGRNEFYRLGFYVSN